MRSLTCGPFLSPLHRVYGPSDALHRWGRLRGNTIKKLDSNASKHTAGSFMAAMHRYVIVVKLLLNLLQEFTVFILDQISDSLKKPLIYLPVESL